MKKYNQLTEYEREVIRVELEQGKKYRAIGRILGRSHATISREVERNTMEQGPDKGKYIACKAHIKAQKRASDQRRKAPLKCPRVFLYVREHLRLGWSPEIIAGRLAIDHPGFSIHHETIYRYIYSKPVKNRYQLWKFLRLRRKKRREKTGRSVRRYRGKIPNATSIDLRPNEANDRLEVGHWETDNMEGKRTERKAVSVTIDRKLRYTLLELMPDQKSETKRQAVVDGLSPLTELFKKTITYDNGTENAKHKQISEDLKMSGYFCHAYHSWEKGSVENVIGLIRWYLPKKQGLASVTHEQINWVQNQLNHMPRKCLGFKTPHEKMVEELSRYQSAP